MYIHVVYKREIMLFIEKPKGRSRMISNYIQSKMISGCTFDLMMDMYKYVKLVRTQYIGSYLPK